MPVSVDISGEASQDQIRDAIAETSIRYDQTQALTTAQKSRARANIGAETSIEVTQTIAADNTTQAPSSDAVFDALALKTTASTLAGSGGSALVGHKPADTNAAPLFGTTFQIMNQVPSLLSWLPNFTISATESVNRAAFNAFLTDMGTRGRTECKMPGGLFPVDGPLTAGVDNIALHGAGGADTIIVSSDTTGDLLTVTGEFFRLSGVGFSTPGATAGACIKWTGDKGSTENIYVFEGFNGYESENTGVCTNYDWKMYNLLNTCLYLRDGVQGFTLVGADFSPNSAGNCLSGAVRLENWVTACRLTKVETLGGYRSLVMTASVLSEVTAPGYAVFVGCFFDGAARESQIYKTLLNEMIGCEFSSGRTGSGYDGLDLQGNKGLKFLGGKANNCGKHGVAYASDNVSVDFIGFDACDNGYTDANGRGFSFANNSVGFSVLGGRAGNGYSSSGLGQKYGVVTGTGCEGSVIGVDLRSNVTAAVVNSSTSAKMIYENNKGAESFDRRSTGGGTPMKAILTGTATYDPPSMATGTGATTFVTVTGAAVGDRAVATHSSIAAGGWIVSATVTGADNVAVTFFNLTGGTVDLASGTLTVTVFKT